MTRLDLSAFEGLQHNWDGHDAIAPDLETIENFRSIAENLDWPSFDIYATPTGTLDLENDDTPDLFHLSVGLTRWDMYVRLYIDGQYVQTFTTGGVFSTDLFPFGEAQAALNSLRKE